MPFPTPKVSIAFSDGPYVASPTWTDVSSYVRSATTDRGRSDDWGPFQGSAQVVLDNRDRRFDPYNASGPYYGNLLPRRQIKIEATYSGTTYAVFRGFISGWPDTWTDAGKDSTVTLSCFDALQLLGTAQGPADWAYDYIKNTLNPAHYYQFTEPITPFTSGQTLKDHGTRAQDLTTTAFAQPGPELAAGLVSSSLSGFEDPTGVVTDGVAAGGSTLANPTYMTRASTTVALWFDHPNALNDGSYVLEGGFNDWWYYVVIENTDARPNCLRVSYGDQSDTYDMYATVKDMSFGPHHVAFSINTASSDAMKIYLDGVDVTGTRTRNSGYLLRSREYIRIFNGPVTQIVVYSGVLAEAQIREIYKYSTVNLKESTKQRAQRLLDLTSLPAARYSLPSTVNANVLDITDDAPYIGPELQIVADTESAPLFCAKDGVLTMYNSTTVFTQTKSTTSQQTYGSGGLPMGPTISIWPDGDSMRNVVNVQMSQGGVQQYKDSTSVTNNGTNSVSWITQAATIADANVSGNMIKTLGSTVYPKTTPLEVVMSSNENWASTLGLELCERITVVTAPPTGSSISLPMLVQRISHEIVPGQWRTTLEGSNRWAQSYTP